MKHRTVKPNQYQPRSKSYGGQYGRLFRQLPPAALSDDDIASLSDNDIDALVKSLSNKIKPGKKGPSNIPAGYTYFGQFIDHDITFDPVSFAVRGRDPDSIINARTPALDLDSLYGRGPDLDPYLYTSTSSTGSNFFFLSRPKHSPKEWDLLRRQEYQGERLQPRLATIPDPRNDEHLIISQMHVAFQRLHNKISRDLKNFEKSNLISFYSESKFSRARQVLLWHYQWLIVNDYLPRICNHKVLQEILGNTWKRGDSFSPTAEPRYYKYKYNPYIPLEFSGAAFRFGHSMVRNQYHVNDRMADPAPLFPLNRRGDLSGFRVLRPGWTIQWNLFFDDRSKSKTLQFSNLIDPSLSSSLEQVPKHSTSETLSLFEANIKRGLQLKLPSGQAVARLMGVQVSKIVKPEKGFMEDPLWLYVLKEATNNKGENKLGTVGSTIVAETLLGLILADDFSYVNMFPGWKPFLKDPKRKYKRNMSDYSLYDLFSWGDLPMTKEDIEKLII